MNSSSLSLKAVISCLAGYGGFLSCAASDVVQRARSGPITSHRLAVNMASAAAGKAVPGGDTVVLQAALGVVTGGAALPQRFGKLIG